MSNLHEIPTTAEFAAMSVHRPHQSESLAREIRSLEWALNGRSEHNGQPMPQFAGGGDEPVNREYLEESLTRTRQLHQRHAAEGLADQFSGYQKNLIYREMQADEAEIREGMPTHEMMEEPNSTNVDWWRAWHTSKKQRILAWRARRRILDPRNDDPNFCNVSIMRKHELTGGDPRKYWSGYEQIAFTERVEEQLDQISDTQYLEFLKLKALDWAVVSICKQLGWTKRTYQAAWQRLQSMSGAEGALLEPVEDLADSPSSPVLPEQEPDETDEEVEEAEEAEEQRDPAVIEAGAEWQRRVDAAQLSYRRVAKYLSMPQRTLMRKFAGAHSFTEKQVKVLETLMASRETSVT